MTDKLRQAMKLALDALEGSYAVHPDEAITALREALAEQEIVLDLEPDVLAKLESDLAEQAEQDLDTCPGCGGVADNGHDREFPPNPYYCTRCTEQTEQEPVASPDKGLWTVKQWGTDKVVLLSGDFTHDVALAISGDFLNIEQRLDYALNLATWMNHHLQNSAPVRTKDLTDDEKLALAKRFPAHLTFDAINAVIAAYREKNK